MSSHQNTSNGGGMMRRNNNLNNRSSSSSKSRSRSRSKSLSRRGSSGQSSLSAHIKQQMERPRRKGRDPTPLSRSVRNKSAPDLNYRQPPPSQPSTFLSPPRRSSAGLSQRTVVNHPTNKSVESSPSSSQERAAIAANLAKNSLSAHQNLQKLIDEQWEREFHRMEHAQKMQVRQPQNQQVADLEVVQSIAKIMAFHQKNSAPGTPSQRIQIVSYDDNNNFAQQQQQQRRSKSQPTMDRMDKYDSFEIKNEEFCSLHSKTTATTTASSLSSELSPTSEPSNHSSSFKTPPRNKQPQLWRRNSSTRRHIGRETLYNHLQDAPRESRVHLTRHIENLQIENHRLNEVNLTQEKKIDKLESEIGGLVEELLRYRLEFGDMTTAAEGGGSVGIASPYRPRTGQRSFNEGKKEDAQTTLRWRGVKAISNQQLLLMLQQQEQEEYHQDEVSRGTRDRSNSLEDKFEPRSDRSCFVEQKGGNTSSGRVPGSVSVPSMTDTKK